MKAYDLAFGPTSNELTWNPRGGEAANLPDAREIGWTGAEGPGIPVESWPRGSMTGRPMWHALTIELPEEYRTRGEELVGISFFQGEGQFAEEDEQISAAWSGTAPNDDPFLVQLASVAGKKHPRCDILEDMIGGEFAVIWLTREEFEGRTNPPEDPRREGEWAEDDCGANAWDGEAVSTKIWIGERVGDVNAGYAPEEGYLEPGEELLTGEYRPLAYDKTGEPEWDKWVEFGETARGRCHLGGTTFCCQAVPEISAKYLEIEEFGALNFGGGNAQYCLETGEFEWAC
ncbi:hypothetical protein [Corynebacterium sp. H130]|uniref:hypothetical protein n=1 Tax=Corynebacterium sp. H130 TaxID=3133444 RepID=UPI00309B22A6